MHQIEHGFAVYRSTGAAARLYGLGYANGAAALAKYGEGAANTAGDATYAAL